MESCENSNYFEKFEIKLRKLNIVEKKEGKFIGKLSKIVTTNGKRKVLENSLKKGKVYWQIKSKLLLKLEKCLNKIDVIDKEKSIFNKLNSRKWNWVIFGIWKEFLGKFLGRNGLK